ncbi:MAG TPA: Fic family protein [bacterium]|nr:Fic family protein [bacterium]
MVYIPPFNVSVKAVNLIAEISALVERYAIRLEQKEGVHLRKVNRIKTIRGSLAIEGNTLSESMITDIIEGKTVVAPIREIQEVKNAIKTYTVYSEFDPFSVEDMLKAHGLMMDLLADDAGHFRKTGVGVFAGGKAVHIAPPADRVPYLMDDLFKWLKSSKDHLLIKSCVFHYEFEFIHPFSDGNGRTGRLWQSLILAKLNPVFSHLPVENMVFQNQQKYYQAIRKSTSAADSGIFIDFMLEEILKTLKERKGEPLKKVGGVIGGVNGGVNPVLEFIQNNPMCRIPTIVEATGISKRTVERIIKELKEQNKIEFTGAPKNGGYRVKE